MSEQHETTPAGSYRIPGQDVSGYLGVDPEYMNSSDHTQEASLTEEERYLFLPAEAGDEEANSENLDLADGDAEEHEDAEESATYVPPADDESEAPSGETAFGETKADLPERPAL